MDKDQISLFLSRCSQPSISIYPLSGIRDRKPCRPLFQTCPWSGHRTRRQDLRASMGNLCLGQAEHSELRRSLVSGFPEQNVISDLAQVMQDAENRAMGRTPRVLHQGRLLWGVCWHRGLPSAPHRPVEGSPRSAVILRGWDCPMQLLVALCWAEDSVVVGKRY